jgi:hypothetical protein
LIQHRRSAEFAVIPSTTVAKKQLTVGAFFARKIRFRRLLEASSARSQRLRDGRG